MTDSIEIRRSKWTLVKPAVGLVALAFAFGILALIEPIAMWFRMASGLLSVFSAVGVIGVIAGVVSGLPAIVIDGSGVQVQYSTLVRKLRHIPWSDVLDVELIDLSPMARQLGKEDSFGEPALRIRTSERGWFSHKVTVLIGESNLPPQDVLEHINAHWPLPVRTQ
ncbi:hypothetical protein N5J06_20010 [Ralstonia sp. CHL-2022]|uniref:PH domain-containing protein n=1 Tax=Ralstonia mojiangensis TaxID=2953895 RepID=A0ABT2LD77_9RALS|nr:hypothetical protein [Ralstonia mojiangensis]MCT7313265.1 hypothetical protein [Ralstonia mojiangensis]